MGGTGQGVGTQKTKPGVPALRQLTLWLGHRQWLNNHVGRRVMGSRCWVDSDGQTDRIRGGGRRGKL